MITKELKELVILEATNLKIYASKEELNKLDFNRLSVGDIDLCIYGQMTGSCYSDRSKQLLNNCTKPYSEHLGVYYNISSHKTFKSASLRDFSPIEFYIYQQDAKNETLIKFLKSEIDNLTTKML